MRNPRKGVTTSLSDYLRKILNTNIAAVQNSFQQENVTLRISENICSTRENQTKGSDGKNIRRNEP